MQDMTLALHVHAGSVALNSQSANEEVMRKTTTLTATKFAAWALLAIGLFVNVAYLVNPNSGPYPVLALLPVIVAIVLLIPIVRDSRRRRRQ